MDEQIKPGFEISIHSRRFQDAGEIAHWHQTRLRAFTEWYSGVLAPRRLNRARDTENAKARLFPEFLLQARTRGGKSIGYLASVPGYWSGAVQALHDLNYYDEYFDFRPLQSLSLTLLHRLCPERLPGGGLFEWATRRHRSGKLAGANCIILISIVIDPEYRGRNIPSSFLAAAKENAGRLGMRFVLSPFRPSAYGPYKLARKATHSPELIADYCGQRTAAGLPQDPWLRNLARNGVEFLRIDPRCYQVSRSIEQFDVFRRRFKPDNWYSPEFDVWECGETQTWYVDRCRKQVVSVEPNLWGVIKL